MNAFLGLFCVCGRGQLTHAQKNGIEKARFRTRGSLPDFFCLNEMLDPVTCFRNFP